jgi:hypothetical protein
VRQPLCIDLFSGLGGFTSGFLEEGYDCVGFDIERHQYGDKKYPAQLVLQDVLTLHGRQFKDASCIVASPPCQFFSYTAMPWSRAKQLATDVRADPTRLAKELALFEACFRIQREASEAAGHHIPMVVENVQGAQAWVGPAKAHYGSFYLWGDVDQVGNRIIAGQVEFGAGLVAPTRGGQKFNPDGTNHGQGSWFKIANSKERGRKNGDLGGELVRAGKRRNGRGESRQGWNEGFCHGPWPRP